MCENMIVLCARLFSEHQCFKTCFVVSSLQPEADTYKDTLTHIAFVLVHAGVAGVTPASSGARGNSWPPRTSGSGRKFSKPGAQVVYHFGRRSCTMAQQQRGGASFTEFHVGMPPDDMGDVWRGCVEAETCIAWQGGGVHVIWWCHIASAFIVQPELDQVTACFGCVVRRMPSSWHLAFGMERIDVASSS